jgi:hypothetical protein
MNMPGFTAESSLERTMQNHRVGPENATLQGTVVPAACIGAIASICQSACDDVIAYCSGPLGGRRVV